MPSRDQARNYPSLWLVFCATGISLVIGALTALSATFSAAIVLGTAFAVVGLFLSLESLVLLQLLFATVLAGSIEYFGHISQAHWISFLLGLLIAFKALIQTRTERQGHASNPATVSFAPCAIVYIAIVAFASVANLVPLGQVIVGFKNYLFMWGLLFAVAAAAIPEKLMSRFWSLIVVVASLQLPVTLYQKFFVASKLSDVGGAGGLSWDAVVGTFGGSEMGGHSGSMALFIAMALVVAAMAWREREFSGKRFLFVILLAVPSVLLAEVKAFVVWLAIGFLAVFARQIRSRPIEFVGTLIGAGVLVAAVGLTYKSLYYDTGRQGTTYEDVYEKQIHYFLDPQKFNAETRQIGRVASIIFWWSEQRIEDPVGLLVGNGIGSSRSVSTFGPGEAAARHLFKIDTSALTMLLWDFGLLGAFAFVSMIGAGAVQAFRLSASPSLTSHMRSYVRLAGTALFMILAGLSYTSDAIDDASVEILMFFSLGTVAYAARLDAIARRSASAANC